MFYFDLQHLYLSAKMNSFDILKYKIILLVKVRDYQDFDTLTKNL